MTTLPATLDNPTTLAGFLLKQWWFTDLIFHHRRDKFASRRDVAGPVNPAERMRLAPGPVPLRRRRRIHRVSALLLPSPTPGLLTQAQQRPKVPPEGNHKFRFLRGAQLLLSDGPRSRRLSDGPRSRRRLGSDRGFKLEHECSQSPASLLRAAFKSQYRPMAGRESATV